jgi:hypothetical protein
MKVVVRGRQSKSGPVVLDILVKADPGYTLTLRPTPSQWRSGYSVRYYHPQLVRNGQEITTAQGPGFSSCHFLLQVELPKW